MFRRQVIAMLPTAALGVPVLANGQGALSENGIARSTETMVEVRRVIALMTMTEAALLFASQLNRKINKSDYLKIRGMYDDKTWQLYIEGGINEAPVRVNLIGGIWGDEQNDLLVTYAGGGQVGKTPTIIQGKVDWPYDRERKDYLSTDFWHLAKFGENSTWDWCTTAEVAFGAFGGAALAASGVGIAGLVAMMVSASSHAYLFKSLSSSERVVARSETPVAPPPLPPRPVVPSSQDGYKPQEDDVVVEIFTEGSATIRVYKIQGRGAGTAGAISGSAQNGRVSGTIDWREGK